MQAEIRSSGKRGGEETEEEEVADAEEDEEEERMRPERRSMVFACLGGCDVCFGKVRA